MACSCVIAQINHYNMTLNSIVIDPNALQRMDTVKKSNDHNSVNLLAEFSSCIEANEFLVNTDVDLIFLEIEMPKMRGFEFLIPAALTGRRFVDVGPCMNRKP